MKPENPPEFILVTGPNASGKTTLIEKNRAGLEAAGYNIIIPDKLLEYTTEHTDVSAVIKEHVEEALAAKTNFILETPFQFKNLKKILDQIKDAGYRMSMYQLFVKSAGESASRVEARYKTGGLYIDPDQVRDNFNANLKNVAVSYDRFDEATFIDNSSTRKMKRVAEFRENKLVLFRPIEHSYLRDLFKYSTSKGKTKAKDNKIIQSDKIFPPLLPKKHQSAKRLKL